MSLSNLVIPSRREAAALLGLAPEAETHPVLVGIGRQPDPAIHQPVAFPQRTSLVHCERSLIKLESCCEAHLMLLEDLGRAQSVEVLKKVSFLGP